MSEKELTHKGAQSPEHSSEEHLGMAGRTARFFINSPLSPLFFISMMAMGLLGLVMTPRQEDPQISVPMLDIFVQYPGATADQVANLAIQPLERIMSEIPAVKHVYSASQRGMGMVTIEFEVGEQMGPSLVKVNDKLDSNMDKIPPGVMPPLVKAKGIDDVPVVNITLWSKDMDRDGIPDVDDGQLRMLAQDLLQSIKQIPNTGNSFVVGGRAEQVTVEVFPERLSGYNISLDQVAQTIQTANSEQRAGGVESGDIHFSVISGSFLKTIDDIARLVVGTHNNVPVYVHDVARVTQGPQDASQLVAYYTGPAGPEGLHATGAPAVTIAIAKKQGTNGVEVANAIIERVNQLKSPEDVRNRKIPDNVEVSITRDYGQTANDKVNELITKLFIATAFVFLLVLWAFRAFRPAVVVVLVIPVVLLFTIFIAWVSGYTINRVSLFALIFSIGILVDDAIVVVENIDRHWAMKDGRSKVQAAIDAVAEVGNPTIVATLTVIAALLPMMFVSGLMGPYMSPIPANASAAMVFSFFVAMVLTPWLMVKLRPGDHAHAGHGRGEGGGYGWLARTYLAAARPVVATKARAWTFLLLVGGATMAAMVPFYSQDVTVKLLPFDNKSELQVVVDLPRGASLEDTGRALLEAADRLKDLPELASVQAYAGTAAPFNFNGLVRHYFLRDQPEQGDLQVNLAPKHDRDRPSHAIALDIRERLKDLPVPAGTSVKVVEVPPGPPVLATLLMEVYGPDAETRHAATRVVEQAFRDVDFVVDVDTTVRDPGERVRFALDRESLEFHGVEEEAVYDTLQALMGGVPVGYSHRGPGRTPIEIAVRLPRSDLHLTEAILTTPVPGAKGPVELGDLVTMAREAASHPIFRRNGRAAEMVMADLAGRFEAPVYGMLAVQDRLAAVDWRAAGFAAAPEISLYGQPPDPAPPTLLWEGEWEITYVTFRDMGAAFAVAILGIYLLVVAQFGSFRLPLVILAPVPLTLIGIVLGHWLFDAAFTATSMIGFIALAGIVVRNSILLVDFIRHRQGQGIAMREVVLEAGAIRFKPILLTAVAAMIGAAFILTDPIFQGLAISMLFGLFSSTLLTVLVIPAIYVVLRDDAGGVLSPAPAVTAAAG